MKFNCNQADFLGAVSSANRFVNSSSTHPILASLLFNTSVDKQEITISSFDLTNGLKITFKVQNLDTSETIAIPGKLLQGIIEGLNGELNFSFNNDELAINPVGKKNIYKVRGVNPKEFPVIPSVSAYHIEVNAHAFKKGIKATSFACSADPTKLILSGARVIFKEYEIDFASTNGSMLATYKLDFEHPVYGDDEETKTVIIPAKTLTELDKIISKTTGESSLLIGFDGNQIQFQVDNCILVSRVIDGVYPEVERLVPSEFKQSILVDRKELINSISNIIKVGNENTCFVFSLDVDNSEISLECDRDEISSGKEYLNVESATESINLLFSGKNIIAGLREMSCDKVTVNINESLTAVTFSCDDNMLFLTMPMQTK